MREHNGERKTANRRGVGRRGLGSVMATVILVVTIGIVGAVNYVVLNASGIAHTTTTTEKSCAPSSAPQCGGEGNSRDAISHAAVAVTPTS